MITFKEYITEMVDSINQGKYSIAAKSFIKALDELDVTPDEDSEYRGLYDVDADVFIIWDAIDFIHDLGQKTIKQIKNKKTPIFQISISLGGKFVGAKLVGKDRTINSKEIMKIMKKFFRGFTVIIQ